MVQNRYSFSVLLLSFIISSCGSKGTETPNPKLAGNAAVFKMLPTADTNIKQLYPEETKGSSEKIDVWNYPDQDKQAFVKFNFSEVSQYKLKKAVLKLYVYSLRNPGLIHFHAVHGQWEESSLTYSSAGKLNLIHLFPYLLRASDLNTYVEVDVTELVQKWLEGSLPNDGLSITADETGDYVRVDFSSRDALVNPSFLELTLE